MDITTRIEFAAQPQDVYAMMTDQAYLAEVCQATDSRTYEATVVGSTTKTTRTFAAPDAVARFTGGELTVTEETVWGPAGADGQQTGNLTMTVKGQPVSLKGHVVVAAGGPGTVVQLTGDLKVAIPLLGKKLEQSTAPAVLEGFKTQQEVGARWLAR
ncbi:DUF2505 domain-containing protein [uncultured Friedmanniella sp.]|uniref:DUF2505 domain-containing protein n=1 Tax=uncultured Friedmanniella sp. TaxID=335381 RepID=UPI0035CAF8BD